MIAEIEAAKKDGDTLGGIVEVVVDGLPIGLGSFTSGENRLDSQLAGAVMGIQAIKGVEIGDGFETARRRGSVAHDEIYPGPDGVMRSTNRAGGLEGGMTNGQPLRVRAAMKPISTVPRALATDRHGHRRRGRRHPPALRRVRGARGGCRRRDHGRAGAGARGAGEVRRRLAGRDPRQRRRLPADGRCSPGGQERSDRGSMAASRSGAIQPSRRRADGAEGRPGGHARLGQVHDRTSPGQGADVPLLDTDAKIVETTGRTIAEIFVEGEPEFRRIEADVVRAALAEHDGVVSLGGGAITSADVREALAGHTVIYLEISAAEGIRRTSGGAGRPLLAGDPEERFRDADGRSGAAVPAGRHHADQHQPPQPRRRGAPHRASSRLRRGRCPNPADAAADPRGAGCRPS